MLSPVGMMPRSWYTTVTVLRGGGRDDRGVLQQPQRIELPKCLVAPRATVEPLDRSDVVNSDAMIYHETFQFESTDRIEVPAGQRMAGTYAVDGRAGEWPLGVEVGLRSL